MEAPSPSLPPPPPLSIRCWTDIVQKPPLPKPPEPSISNRVLFNSCKSSKGIAVAVVDASAIIQGGDKLTSCADKFVSVREVLAEVRDPESRHRLEFMPFTVDVMEPTPEALKKVINFARATGDLQTLSDVDLKLIALTYTLEAQIHGTNHLRDSPPPLHTVNLKRLPEKDMPGWGSNVPNLAEWEALENAVELSSDFSSRILPLKDLSLNIPVDGHGGSGDVITESKGNIQAESHENGDHGSRKTRRFMRPKKEIKIEGKKMVADGIDASQGEGADDASDWMPAVSRSTHRRYLRRIARRELAESSEKLGQPNEANTDAEITESVPDSVPEENRSHLAEATLPESVKGTQVTNVISKDEEAEVSRDRDDDISTILKHMRLEADSSEFDQDQQEPAEIDDALMGKDTLGNDNIVAEGELFGEGLDELEISDICSRTDESVDTSVVDDNSSEQSWMLRSLSDSSVACVTSDFAMQNVILQIGLRLLAPGGKQIRQLHRWILKCHACNKVTSEIGRIFCPKCGNGGTLRKVSVTVGENGIVQAARRPRVTLRGTKFSLPLPQGGRDAITKNLILREDQLPHKVLYPKMKKKPNKEGLEFMSLDDVFSHTSDKRAPFKPPIRKALAVFSGRRNPNDNHFSRRKY